ncbi:MAG TPA: hypothetical protein VJI15_00560 [Candidatus Nanoarchaeia archaeon]|nr:hypothetical protein [Candidatus Nanoarchaeia archaeon]
MTNTTLQEIEETYQSIKASFQKKDPEQAAKQLAEQLKPYEQTFKDLFHFLIKAFSNQQRRDKVTPLVSHSIIITVLLHRLGERDIKTLLTAALHDVLEDTPTTPETLLQEPFWKKHSEQHPELQQVILPNLLQLKEDVSLSREPDGETLPPRYKEHISRLIGAPAAVISTEILDRFCDLMDLEYILNLPAPQRSFRLSCKLIKVKSFVDNITRNRDDYNRQGLAIFREKVKTIEQAYHLTGKSVTITPFATSPEYCPEATLIDTTEGIQCKVYATSHPPGKIIVKPKYIPTDLINFKGLKRRYILEKSMFRFNLFNSKDIVKYNLTELKKGFPHFFYDDPAHQNWFLVVPKENIKQYHDPKEGLRQLMSVPEEDCDPYLKATQGIVSLILQSGISLCDMGISHSTLLSNYTPGKSDIDILIFGKEQGWKALHYLETAQHPRLRWKSPEDWARYYQDRVVSKLFSQQEYVFHQARKRDDGFFDGNVFSIFVIEKEGEIWYEWNDQHEPLGTVKIRGIITDDSHSHLRPGFYELTQSIIFDGNPEIIQKQLPVSRIVTWSRPFALQAKKNEKIEACGLLEKITKKDGHSYYQIVLGYMDTYTSDRGEKEYLKTIRKPATTQEEEHAFL